MDVDDEPEVVVHKKPVKSRALVAVNEKRNLPAIAEPDDEEIEKALKSKFGDKSEVILQMLEMGEDDGAVTLILRSLLQTLVSILPVVEHPVRNSQGQRGIHGFNMTVSQMRELIADVQAVRDKGMLGQHIVERYVRTAFMDIAVQITVGLARLETNARARMTPEDFKTFSKETLEVKSGLANFVHTQYQEVSDNVVKSLS